MTLDTRIELKKIHEAITNWPSDAIKNEQDSKQILVLTDIFFQKIEQDLVSTLGAIQAMPVVQQKEFAHAVHTLKLLVEDKFKIAEQELKDVKARMDYGRNHAKAIRAYAQI